MTTYSNLYDLEEQFRKKIDFTTIVPANFDNYDDDDYVVSKRKKPTNLPRLDKNVLREASSYAYKFLKPRKFLTEINNDVGTELRIFDKWEDSPYVSKWRLPDSREINVATSPLNVFCFDRNKNTFTIKDNGHISFYCLLFKHNLGSAVKIRNLISSLIELYVNKIQGEINAKDRKLIHVEAKKVLFSRFNLSIPAMTKVLAGRIWKNLNREVASLAIKICGDKASSIEYNIILNNLEEVKDTVQKAPGILPIWMSLVKHLINKQNEHYKNSFDAWIMNPPTKPSEFFYPDIIKNTKNYLQESKYPISNGEWKSLINTKISCVRKIMIGSRHVEKFNQFFKFFIRTGMPRFSLIKPIMDMVGHFEERRLIEDDFFATNAPSLSVLESVTRACVNHTKKMKSGIKNFWNREGSLVNDWITNENLNLDKNQMKAPWSWFFRRQAEWHERIQQLERDKLKNTQWDSIVSEYEQDGYTITPLTSSLMLFDEGKEMRHCVASYANRCLCDTSRIFSIKKGDKKIATVEIVKNSVQFNWAVSQVRGFSNSEVSSEVKEIANQIAIKYNDKNTKIV